MATVLILLLIICAIAGSLIAAHKNLGRIYGAIAGLFLGPIGVLIVTVERPKPPKGTPAPPSRKERKRLAREAAKATPEEEVTS